MGTGKEAEGKRESTETLWMLYSDLVDAVGKV